MLGRGVVRGRGHVWQEHAWQGGVHGGGMCVAGQMATAADVRILLECILVNLLILNSKHTDKRIVYKPFFVSIQKGFLCHLVQFTLNWNSDS